MALKESGLLWLVLANIGASTLMLYFVRCHSLVIAQINVLSLAKLLHIITDTILGVPYYNYSILGGSDDLVCR